MGVEEKKSTAQWKKIILHADMDAFFAAVEQLDNPELRGKPVLVGGMSDRGVVSTASYEARVFGVGSAMPMVEARRRCPDAIIVKPNFARYEEVSAAIMSVFRDMSPLVEPLSLDEAFVDMTGAERLFGSPLDMAKELKKGIVEITGGLTASVGVASTKFVAKVASDYRKPDGITLVEPDRTLDFLWPLHVKRLWGVGPKAEQRLLEIGLKTIGEVAKVSEEYLVRQFGSFGTHISKLARGEDSRDVKTTRKRKSVGAERTYEKDIFGAHEIKKQLRKLSKKVAVQLRSKGLRAGGVRVKLKTAKFETRTRQTSLGSPTDSAGYLEREAVRLLDKLDLESPMRLVGIAAFDLEAADAAAQGELFQDPDVGKAREIDKTMDALKARFGDKALFTSDDNSE